jgi:hypothetical protein
MPAESSIIQPVLVAVIVDILSGAVNRIAGGSPPPPPSSSTYIQSDSTNYFQPDGSSLYLIP